MTTQPRRLLRFPDVKNQTGLGRTSIYGMIKTGDFPPGIPISSRAVAWDSDAINSWIESRIQSAQRSA